MPNGRPGGRPGGWMRGRVDRWMSGWVDGQAQRHLILFLTLTLTLARSSASRGEASRGCCPALRRRPATAWSSPPTRAAPCTRCEAAGCFYTGYIQLQRGVVCALLQSVLPYVPLSGVSSFSCVQRLYSRHAVCGVSRGLCGRHATRGSVVCDVGVERASCRPPIVSCPFFLFTFTLGRIYYFVNIAPGTKAAAIRVAAVRS